MSGKQRSIEQDKMLELKRQIEELNTKRVKIKQMTYLKGVNLLLNNNEDVILIEEELENKEKEYELYKVEQEKFIKIAEYDREQNELVLMQEYLEEEMEKAGLQQEIEVRLTPEELVEKAKEQEQLEDVKQQTSELEDVNIDDDEKDTDGLEVKAMQEELGIDLVKCYKIEDEEFASNVLGRETGEDHYIGIEKGTGRVVVVSGNSKDGFDENKELHAGIGGGEASEQNADLVIKDKNNRPVMVLNTETNDCYILEEDEEGKKVPKRIDAKPINVEEEKKYSQEPEIEEETVAMENPEEDEQEDDALTIYPDYPGERTLYK